MKMKKNSILAAALSLLLVFGLYTPVGASSEAPEELRVPLRISISEPIAGAEFELEVTPELKILAFEKSDVTMSAMVTPVVEKGSTVNLGFFSGDNDFAPENGELDVGWLVVDYAGAEGQSITITEMKYVQVIDKDTTHSEILPMNIKMNIPLETDVPLAAAPANILWLVLAAALVVAAIVVIVLVRRKKSKNKG